MKAKDKCFVISMCLVLVTLTSNYAIMVTFFPLYAKDKGMSRNAVSMIFTSFSIANLLMSMIAGTLASAFGRRALLIWGVLQVSAAGCLIGFTPEIAQGDITWVAGYSQEAGRCRVAAWRLRASRSLRS